jgi:hypothetical protein
MRDFRHRENDDWRRVTRGDPCPICGRPDWCLVAGSKDAPTAAICARIESAKLCGEAGWLHRLRDDWLRVPTRRTVAIDTPPTVRNLSQFANNCRAVLGHHSRQLLAIDLKVTGESLSRLHVGWSRGHRAFTFPMLDAVGMVRGIRLRGTNGRKWSVRGGHEGLFIPDGLTVNDLLVISEGPTDTAALLDLDFAAVGRPSCSGGVHLVVDLVVARGPKEIAVIADGDLPGERGARNLAALLASYVPKVRTIVPPAGIKDVREWKHRGATHAEIRRAINDRDPLSLAVMTRSVQR